MNIFPWSTTGETILAIYSAYIKDFTTIFERRRREFFCNLQRLYKRFYNDFEAPQAKILTICSAYIRDSTTIWSAAGEKFFGNLHRLHRGFSSIWSITFIDLVYRELSAVNENTLAPPIQVN